MNRLAVALALAAFASPAFAASPRWGSLELGVQNYRPNIDEEFPLPRTEPPPFERHFGTERGWMFTLAVSRALWTKVGSLEVGLRTGYFQDTGDGYFADGTASSEDTKLKIVPSSLVVSYRLDDLPDRWKIPLAPYVRLAFERYNWWITDGGGDTAQRGATMGWSATGGIGLLLDFLDPTLAREFDADQGVNHTYLFFEVTKSSIDDFGSSSSWDMSDEDVSFAGGLMFVF